jgi:hypothetical protein
LSAAGAAVGAGVRLFTVSCAHAAYHPHIAQIQWLPLSARVVEVRGRPVVPIARRARRRGRGGDTLEFYGGFIAAVITPAALLFCWLATLQSHRCHGTGWR